MPQASKGKAEIEDRCRAPQRETASPGDGSVESAEGTYFLAHAEVFQSPRTLD